MSAADPTDQLSRGDALDVLAEVWRLNHSIERASTRMEALLGITAQQRLLIRLVGRHGSISAGDLARLLCVDASTVSTSVKRLEKRKLLKRRRDPNDARRTIIELLHAGRQLDRQEAASIEAALEGVLQQTSAAKLEVVREFLRRLVERVDGVGT